MVLISKTEEDRLNEDFDWLSKNTVKLQKRYEGKWVAIIDKKIAGVGTNAKEAYANAKKLHPKREPLLGIIPKKDVLIL